MAISLPTGTSKGSLRGIYEAITQLLGGAGGSGSLDVTDAVGADATGSITTNTGTVSSSATDGYSTVEFSIKGTYAGFSAVFEQSDNGGTDWFPVDASRAGTGQVEQGITNLTNQSLIWKANISGSDSFRVRATALTSGTVTVLESFSGMPTSAGVGIVANFADNHPSAGTITTRDVGSTRTTGMSSSVQITGSATANSTFGVAINGYSHMVVLISGTWTGSLELEKSIDGGTTWTPFGGHIEGTIDTESVVTANCHMRASCGAATNVRVAATAAMTGTANILFAFAAADTVTTVTNALRIQDGTAGAAGGVAAVKPASTAAVATDPAFVVAISPNGLNSNGRAAAASSTPTVQSTEDFAEAKRASAATKANVASSASSVTLLALNTSRKAVTIVNDSTAILYIDASGGTASSSSYTHQLPGTGGGTPASLTLNNFTGLITGIWASATGNARVSEYT